MDRPELDIPELARALDRERILRARAKSPWEKLQAGGDLFDAACQRMIWGIKTQFPDLTEAQVQAELARRLAIARRLETPR